MKNIFQIIAVLGVLLVCKNVSAQWNERNYWEFGLMLGGSSYHGELTERLNNTEDWNAASSFIMKYHFDRTSSLRFAISAGTISGNDLNSIYAWRRNRNLNFRSRILDVSFVPEIHLFTGPAFNRGIHPYVSAGFAFAYFNPKANLNNEWIDLQPLGTEGQGLIYNGAPGDKYSLTTLAFPLGLGIEAHVGNSWFLSVDVRYNVTLTDYLDDVSTYYPSQSAMLAAYGVGSNNVVLSDRRLVPENSTTGSLDDLRGDPQNKDRYLFFGIVLSKKMISMPCNAF
ncbi:MAG: outer membrane beta-barrel protein [Bacteroidetes bacterium]|nr:outer membrane beta-barrel protein [Bacteroidota bacterium]